MHGYVLKTDPPTDLIKALRAVYRGGVWLSPSLALEQEAGAAVPSLTEREREVLAAIAAGSSNQEVAEDLFIAEGTVKFHVNNILTKLGASDRTEAVVLGLQRGLLRLPASP
jgi:two-component system NarL family response regulator